MSNLQNIRPMCLPKPLDDTNHPFKSAKCFCYPEQFVGTTTSIAPTQNITYGLAKDTCSNTSKPKESYSYCFSLSNTGNHFLYSNDTTISNIDDHQDLELVNNNMDFSNNKLTAKENIEIPYDLKRDELPKDLITQEEAAKMLNVTTRAIRRYAQNGLFKPHYLGKQPFYLKKEIIKKMLAND